MHFQSTQILHSYKSYISKLLKAVCFLFRMKKSLFLFLLNQVIGYNIIQSAKVKYKFCSVVLGYVTAIN